MNPTPITHLPTVALRVAVIATLKPVLRFDLRAGITPMSKLIEDLSMDSLDRQTVACELEEAFALELSDDEVAGWCMVEDIARSLEAAASAKAVACIPIKNFTIVESVDWNCPARPNLTALGLEDAEGRN